MQSPWYHDWVRDFADPSGLRSSFFFYLFKFFFLGFHRSTFYFLEIEFHVFPFYFFLWSYHVLIWFIKNYSSNFFLCVSFYEIIPILCSLQQSLRVNPVWLSFFIFFNFYLISPFIIELFHNPGWLKSSFFIFFIVIFSFFLYCCCIVLIILFKLQIKPITRVLILFIYFFILKKILFSLWDTVYHKFSLYVFTF